MHLKNLITRYFKWTRNIPPNGKHFFSKILNRCCWCKDNFWINENPTTFKLSFNEKLKEKCTYKEAALTQTHARVVFTKETVWYVAKDVTISSLFHCQTSYSNNNQWCQWSGFNRNFTSPSQQEICSVDFFITPQADQSQPQYHCFSLLFWDKMLLII